MGLLMGLLYSVLLTLCVIFGIAALVMSCYKMYIIALDSSDIINDIKEIITDIRNFLSTGSNLWNIFSQNRSKKYGGIYL